MPKQCMGATLVAVGVFVFSAALFAQTAAQPKTAKGKVAARDLSGVWDVERMKDRGQFSKEEPSMLPWALEKYWTIREGASENERREDMDPLFK